MATSSSVLIYDTTLRDGEQAPGFSMTPAEKLTLGRQIERLGVDVLEVGFPASSADDAKASRELAATLTRARVSVLARARKDDIDACLAALAPAGSGRVHVFIATSELHIRAKLRTTPERNLEDARAAVRYARNGCDDVQFGCEDASRSDPDYLCRIVEAAVAAGASTIDLADTVGYLLPDEFGELVAMVRNRVPNIDRAVLAVHCHDDLGLAVANSLAGLRAGARQVECTVNGIGERAGNASLEEIVMCLAVRGSAHQLTAAVNTELLYPTSQLLSRITGIGVQPNKAIVGANAFSHEAGIHQHGLLANSLTYEVVEPARVGAPPRRLVMGRHSGRWALRDRLRGMDLRLPDERLVEVLELLKERSTTGQLSDAAIEEVVRGFVVDHPANAPERR